MQVSHLPKLRNDAAKDVIKNLGNKDARVVRKNVKLEFVSSDDSVYLSDTGQEMKYGDISVDNINSFYLGRHIIRNGDRPQRISRANDPSTQFYNLNKKLFDRAGVYVDKSVTLSGCFKSNKVTLQRTATPDIDSKFSRPPTMATIKHFSAAIKNAIRKLRIQQLPKCSIHDIKNINYNAKTYPGFSYKEYYNFRNKGEASQCALKLAMKRWRVITNAGRKGRILKRNQIFPNTFAVGARNKRDYTYECGDVLSSRAVHMPEFHTELNSSVWIESISSHIKYNAKGPIYIGNSIIRFERLKNDTDYCNYILEGDWKRFDSRLYITNIIIGIALCRLYYDLDDVDIDNHFIAIFDTIGIKDYYTPGGYMYRLIHGLPSGVCSTTLIGSFINLVNLLHCSGNVNSKRIKLIIGGDDFLIALDNNINADKLITDMKIKAEEIGQVFKFLDKKTFNTDNVFDKPTFFKYTIDKDEPIISPVALLERVFLPWNKGYNSNVKIYNFLLDLIPSLGAPRSFHVPFYNFYKYIASNVLGRDVKLSEIFQLHSLTFNNMIMNNRYYRRNSSEYYNDFNVIPYNNSASIKGKTKVVRHYLLDGRRNIKKLKIIKV